MQKFFSIVIMSTIGLLCALNNTVYSAAGAGAGDNPDDFHSGRKRPGNEMHGRAVPGAPKAKRARMDSEAAGGAGGHPQLADPVLAMVVYTPATNFPLMTAQQDIAGQQKPVGLKAIPHNALGVVAGYLDPKSALALRATDTSLRGALPSNKVMANYVIDKMVSGGTPNPSVVGHLGTMAPKDRQALLRTSLIEKFGKDKVFTIQNTSVFPEDIAAVCQRAYAGADPIIQEHHKDYYIGSLDRERESNFIEAPYRTLRDVIDNPADHKVPTYLTATQAELGTNLAAVDAYFTVHPEVTLVVQAAAGNATFTLGRDNLPASLKKLSLVGDHVTSIGDGFLGRCSGLTAIDLSGLSNVTTIGDRFLIGCSGLTAIDLSPLSKVTTIGDGFLSGCEGLTAIALSALSNVTTIGRYFLEACMGLTDINLSPLSHVTTIGDWFLYCCTGLTTIDLSPLSKVTTIGNFFLSGCEGLTAIDLSALSNVTTIGDGFLRECSGLTAIDLSGLSNVTTIERGFLEACMGLTDINLSPLSHVTTIGDWFLYGCTGLAPEARAAVDAFVAAHR